ncbi:2,3-bisphosphoglycerate-independent phosphoglycerate mutase [Ornithinimicrobium cryptoxanthini]|uniref:2,3-bisphosphoglycerate-independent phosphoglycerate mutase n=1 Tax=Ornithinimicrobium cryptoxanthini TaxID=2934161 RepID=A0ABY4YJ97_9MICO|nr:2,3-bisphosphoglycerate-independent phosphoglycerate mutase [Ornithinimicrobium cryptoxanthini]USQ76858.1 2,3-bisphosphoglycerate-independent phosphoglycerate mutase [Ornithinimicrobium cryptoxanthini]
MNTRPLVLVVMDGVGVGPGDRYDAVATADTPTFDRLRGAGVYQEIFASGTHVGLSSDSDMGNSEVGHNTMGAGRIIAQGAKRVDDAVLGGEIWEGAWRDVVTRATTGDGTLHLIGLLSDGNVHSSWEHLLLLLDHVKADGVQRVRLHTLFDGRDVEDRTADQYAERLEDALATRTEGTGLDWAIASGGGRMVTTMDRYEANWSVVEAGWRAHVQGTARPFTSVGEAIRVLREETPGISDQLLEAFTIVDQEGAPVGRVHDGDAVVIFNFRGDRAIELTRAFVEGSGFTGFDRGTVPDVFFAGMTLYDGDTNMPPVRLVQPPTITDTVSELIARAGLRQLAASETQKFGHMTYFWNGNRSDPFNAQTETYIDIPSDQIEFDKAPQMKAAETADYIVRALQEGGYDFLRSNLAGGDMVGHTGNFDSTVLAVEAVDAAVGAIAAAVEAAGGCLVVTADHGNAEDMVERDKQGQPRASEGGQPLWKTAHSTNPVPLYIVDYSDQEWAAVDGVDAAGLSNLAATLLTLLDLPVPENYRPSLVAVARNSG